jgi:histidine triad (HIT) family protein
MSDCIFCKIVVGEIPANKVYEDDKVLAFLDITPVNPGHTLVIPKEHYDNLLTLPDDLLCHLAQAVKKIASAVLTATGSSGFNLGLNNGKVAGQLVNHFHWHLMPRFDGDGLELWPGGKYGPGEAKILAEKIKNNL